MVKETVPNMLFFIEPKLEDKNENAIRDELTTMMILMLSESVKGTYREYNKSFREGGTYRGHHYAPDGEQSNNCDYLLLGQIVTTSLSEHYIKHFRTAISTTEWNKFLFAWKCYCKYTDTTYEEQRLMSLVQSQGCENFDYYNELVEYAPKVSWIG